MNDCILIVDDERALVKGLKHSLQLEGYNVLTAYDGQEALDLLESETVDLILLDIMLPKVDGLSVLKLVRAKVDTPVIMLSAKGEDVDKILGLEMGADDYIAKPFNTRELLARVKAVLRRKNNKPTGGERLEIGALLIDVPKRKVVVAGKEVDLTVREFDLLHLLANNMGKVFTREQLLQHVWGYQYYGDARTVDVCIRRLREKIEPDAKNPTFIQTKWGVGYYLKEQ